MTYANLMVHLEAGRSNAHVLSVAAGLASQFGAGVIGIAACEPVEIGTWDGTFSGDRAKVEGAMVDDALKMTETEFRTCLAIKPHILEWRSFPTAMPISEIVAVEARSADLVVTGIVSGLFADVSRQADTGDLIRRAGRPVLVVPEAATTSNFERVLVAWQDTRECRRAISDALPLLSEAERVVILEVAPDASNARRSVKGVAAWLGRHGIEADRILVHAQGNDADEIASIADRHQVDLLVAGAFGHSPAHEWAFGGVTRDLLLGGTRCALLSH